MSQETLQAAGTEKPAGKTIAESAQTVGQPTPAEAETRVKDAADTPASAPTEEPTEAQGAAAEDSASVPEGADESTVASDATEVSPAEGATTPSAPAKAQVEPLFSATYDSTLDLLTHYVDTLVGKKQKTFSIGIACVDVVLAILIAFITPSAWPLAILLLVLGCGMLWYRKSGARMVAKRILVRLDPADAHRTVNVYPDRVELVRATGDAYEYPLGELSNVTSDDALVVMAFGHDGVTIPAQGLTKGTLPELASWASKKLAAKSSAATPTQSAPSEHDTTPDEPAK